MFSFFCDERPVDISKYLAMNLPKEKRISIAPLLQKRLREISDIVFLNGKKSSSSSMQEDTISESWDYSDDLERVRIKLKEVLFSDAITIGFTGDADDAKFETLKFTLTPKVARNGKP